MRYFDSTYKTIMEAKAGLITLRCLRRSASIAQDPDLIPTVVYPNMAALDRSAEAEAVAEKIVGSEAVQTKAAVDREAMREVLGSETIREPVLK